MLKLKHTDEPINMFFFCFFPSCVIFITYYSLHERKSKIKYRMTEARSASSVLPPLAEVQLTSSSQGIKEVSFSTDSMQSTIVVDGVLKEVHRTLPYWRCFLDVKQHYTHTPVIEKLETCIPFRVPCQVFSGVEVLWAVSRAVLRVQTGPCEKHILERRREKRRRSGDAPFGAYSPPSPPPPPLSSSSESYQWWDDTRPWSSSGSTGKRSPRPREGKRSPSDTSFPLVSSSSSVASFFGAAYPSGSASRTGCAGTALMGAGKIKSWRGLPSQLVTFYIGTLHFVHRNATAADERSFHIQSVFLYDQPYRLQCVAGMMIHFAFVLYSSGQLLMQARSSGRSVHSFWKEIMVEPPTTTTDCQQQTGKREMARVETPIQGEYMPKLEQSPVAQRLLFPSTTRVLILGMGGNTMAVGLRTALGPQSLIHVVELEPAVTQICEKAGTAWKEDVYYHVFLQDAKQFLENYLREREARRAAAASPSSEQVESENTVPSSQATQRKKQEKPHRKKYPCGKTCSEKKGAAAEKRTQIKRNAKKGGGSQKEERDPGQVGPYVDATVEKRGDQLPLDGYHLIFLDLFEPLTAKMVEEGGSLLQLCYASLSCQDGGMLVANQHELPDLQRLLPLTTLFGDGRVHSVNVRGWKESVVVGWRAPEQGRDTCTATPSDPSPGPVETAVPSMENENSDTTAALLSGQLHTKPKQEDAQEGTKISLSCSVYVARVIQCLYDRYLPGVLPDVKTWLSSVSTCGKAPHRCRIWES